RNSAATCPETARDTLQALAIPRSRDRNEEPKSETPLRLRCGLPRPASETIYERPLAARPGALSLRRRSRGFPPRPRHQGFARQTCALSIELEWRVDKNRIVPPDRFQHQSTC